jgi:hypothetical protein
MRIPSEHWPSRKLPMQTIDIVDESGDLVCISRPTLAVIETGALGA